MSFAVRRHLLRGLSVLGIAPAIGWQPARAAGNHGVLVLGDSLSAEYGLQRGSGWVALMSQRLASKSPPVPVVNASISGETTAGGLSRLPRLLERHRPALLVVELGGNDALRGLDLKTTENNLRAIAAAARQAGARVLLLGMMIPPNFGADYGRRFQAIFAAVARDEKAGLVPFFLDGIADRLELFQSDRIHPTEAAQARMFDNVWPQLIKLL
jgi:acyl-CoA thioesterase I